MKLWNACGYEIWIKCGELEGMKSQVMEQMEWIVFIKYGIVIKMVALYFFYLWKVFESGIMGIKKNSLDVFQ